MATITIKSTAVQTFFKNYAAALASFSADTISTFYSTPLTIYADQGMQTVNKISEIVSFWKEAVKPYKALNIENVAHKILSEEQLSETIFISKVLWRNFDFSGKEIANETNFYILSQRHNKLKINGLIIMS